MFNLENHQTIIHHIKTVNHGLFRSHGDWIETFCNYCGDYERKYNPNHGHLYIAKTFPFYVCFRCDTRGPLFKLLIDTHFTDQEVLRQVKFSQGGSYTYNKSGLKKKYNKQVDLISTYRYFQKKHPQLFEQFLNYIYQRCLDIDPMKYFLHPGIIDNKLVCNLLNYDNSFVTARFIGNYGKLRYKNPSDKQFYYFQNIHEIDTFENIIICEGAFDLINLHNYWRQMNGFYLSMGGMVYNKIIRNLLTDYLLIGKYKFQVIFDQGIYKMDNIKRSITDSINQLNPLCSVNFHVPSSTKDVSELMMLTEV